MTQQPGLFEGLKVVEFGQYIAAPYAGELLAHGGAEVVAVEPVAGSPTRHNSPLGPPGDGRQYINKARGKQALSCNLGSEAGQRIIASLIAGADVVITNMRPGVAERLGIGWENLRDSHPRLIFAQITGFGDSGPLADASCVDDVAQATSGLLRAQGRREEGRAVLTQPMVADFTAGSLLAFGIASALYHREITGLGQRVSTSLVAACLALQQRSASRVEATDGWHDALIEQMATPTNDGVDVEQVQAWRDDQLGHFPFFLNNYRVADGEVTIGAVAANGPRVLELLGFDPTDLTAPACLGDLSVGETVDLVATRMIDWRAEDLVRELRAIGVAASKVQFLEEALADPDLHAAGLWHRFDHPRLGMMTLPAPPVRFSAAGYDPAEETPAVGAHTDAILRDLGYEESVIDQLVADGIVARHEPTAG